MERNAVLTELRLGVGDERSEAAVPHKECGGGEVGGRESAKTRAGPVCRAATSTFREVDFTTLQTGADV